MIAGGVHMAFGIIGGVVAHKNGVNCIIGFLAGIFFGILGILIVSKGGQKWLSS